MEMLRSQMYPLEGTVDADEVKKDIIIAYISLG